MAQYKVTGGTHLGVKGLYGEKTFAAKSEAALHKAIRADLKIADKFPRIKISAPGRRTTHAFVKDGSKNPDIIFEYFFEDMRGIAAVE